MERASDLLLIADDERRAFNFGLYTAELLRMEGLGRPAILHPRAIPADGSWDPPDRMVVASTPLGREQAQALYEAVLNGCLLVAFLPSPELAAVFGLTPTYRTTLGGYLGALVPGFREQPMQFHGPLSRYQPPSDAETILEERDAAPDHLPTGQAAAIRLRRGRGQAILFLYDLPQSVALMRQGDPRRLSMHANEVAPGWRAADMFVGHLDMRLADIPQADLQCHLLRHLLTDTSAEAAPLPWLWYFPSNADTALIVSSDDDWSSREQFETLLQTARHHRVGITFYLVEKTIVTPELREQWAAEGHTFSIHPDLSVPLEWNWQPTVQRHREAFAEKYGIEPGCSVRNHAIPWVGWVQGGRWMREAGFTWDSNYFTCPPNTRSYMTGAGLPCPLVDLDGTVLDIFEQPAQFSDETTLRAGGFPFSLNLETEEAVSLLSDLLFINAEEYHSLLCINTHPVSFATYSRLFWEEVFSAAGALNIPRMALETWAAFWERRLSVSAGAGVKEGNIWRWEVQAPQESADLRLMIPRQWGGERLLGVYWNGEETPGLPRRVHHRSYLSLTIPPGRNSLSALWG
jgi:hypothetical protein